MPRNIAMFFTSVLTSAALVLTPAAAEAGGMSHIGTTGGVFPNLNCKQPVSVGKPISINKPVTIYNNINVYKPVTINKNIEVTTNIDDSKTINVYKPVTINKNVDITKNIDDSKTINVNTDIDNSKNININKNIDASKNIDIDKSVNINKSIVINKGGSEAEAEALAQAMAEASANSSASATVNFSGGGSTTGTTGSNAGATAFVGGGMVPESPGPFAGGDLGTLAVGSAQVAVAYQAECTFEDATVIKAIHAVCVAADGREFPASHMLADSWVATSYEGEVARCIPGAHLKLTVGAVFQSNEGMAASWSQGQVLECGAHEAVRHYKDGMLKCAAAVPVPDCTERNNLRQYGSGDLFFTYRTKVCRQTHQEYAESISRQPREIGESKVTE